MISQPSFFLAGYHIINGYLWSCDINIAMTKILIIAFYTFTWLVITVFQMITSVIAVPQKYYFIATPSNKYQQCPESNNALEILRKVGKLMDCTGTSLDSCCERWLLCQAFLVPWPRKAKEGQGRKETQWTSARYQRICWSLGRRACALTTTMRQRTVNDSRSFMTWEAEHHENMII